MDGNSSFGGSQAGTYYGEGNFAPGTADKISPSESNGDFMQSTMKFQAAMVAS